MSNLDPRNFTYDEPEEGGNYAVLPKGEYSFHIVEINSMTQSRNHNPMLPIKLEFLGPQGTKTQVYENLVFTEAAAWKVKQFLKCVGGNNLEPGRRIDFEDPQFIAWLAKRTGKAKLKIGHYTKDGKEYEKNEVEAFTYDKADAPPSASAAPAPKPAPAAVEEEVDPDDIPF